MLGKSVISFPMQVKNNGHISFDDGHSQYSPVRLENATTPLIAPFFADADTRDNGTVWYRETTSKADRDRAWREIRAVFREAGGFIPRMVFIATWDHVGYYNPPFPLDNKV